MAKLKAFSTTQVTLFKTQADLETLLARHGIRASRWTHFAETTQQPGTLRFEFEWQRSPDKPPLGYRVELSYQYVEGPRGGNRGTTREQAGRALYWHVKNLMDAVEFGIVEMEQAWLPYMLTPGDRTIYEEFGPTLAAIESGETHLPPLLTEGTVRA